jgi:hypothetical protein
VWAQAARERATAVSRGYFTTTFQTGPLLRPSSGGAYVHLGHERVLRLLGDDVGLTADAAKLKVPCLCLLFPQPPPRLARQIVALPVPVPNCLH